MEWIYLECISAITMVVKSRSKIAILERLLSAMFSARVLIAIL